MTYLVLERAFKQIEAKYNDYIRVESSRHTDEEINTQLTLYVRTLNSLEMDCNHQIYALEDRITHTSYTSRVELERSKTSFGELSARIYILARSIIHNRRVPAAAAALAAARVAIPPAENPIAATCSTGETPLTDGPISSLPTPPRVTHPAGGFGAEVLALELKLKTLKPQDMQLLRHSLSLLNTYFADDPHLIHGTISIINQITKSGIKELDGTAIKYVLDMICPTVDTRFIPSWKNVSSYLKQIEATYLWGNVLSMDQRQSISDMCFALYALAPYLPERVIQAKIESFCIKVGTQLPDWVQSNTMSIKDKLYILAYFLFWHTKVPNVIALSKAPKEFQDKIPSLIAMILTFANKNEPLAIDLIKNVLKIEAGIDVVDWDLTALSMVHYSFPDAHELEIPDAKPSTAWEKANEQTIVYCMSHTSDQICALASKFYCLAHLGHYMSDDTFYSYLNKCLIKLEIKDIFELDPPEALNLREAAGDLGQWLMFNHPDGGEER